jgi:Uma2 family endonuclease
MAAPTTDRISPEEYLTAEKNAFEKHEYFSGQVLALAGAGFAHNRIVANLIAKIGAYLADKDCDVSPSDLRVTTAFFDSYMYPDVTIVCDGIEMQDGVFDTVTNPSIIIEVMSPSTADNDRGYKFFYYLQIPALKEYILVDASKQSIELITRQADDSWKFATITDATGVLEIKTIQYRLPLKDIYHKVFPG